MSRRSWSLVVGYSNGQEARIPCATQEEAMEAWKHLTKANAAPPPPFGALALTNVTGSAWVKTNDPDIRYSFVDGEFGD